MAINWDVTNPGDADIASQFPANERSFRAAVRDGFGLEHDQASGRHKFGLGPTATRDAITDWIAGSIWFNTDDVRHQLQFYSGGVWNYSREFLPGTTLLAHMNTAPIGWVRVLAVHEGRALVMTGGDMAAGGSWTISGMVAVNDGHVHAVVGTTGAENQNHNHGVAIVSSAQAGGTTQGTSASGGASTSLADHTHNVIGTTGLESTAHDHNVVFSSGVPSVAHAHTFDGTWRPAYVTVTAIQKV